MRVHSVDYGETSKIFRLENGRRFEAHRYCCLGPGDDLVFTGAGVAHSRCKNGIATVLPAYRARCAISFGNRTIPLCVKELETEAEIEGYHRLEEYHYRGKILHGRRVPLIVRASDPLLPTVLGYIELSTAFLMNRPRAVLFDSSFFDDATGISWTNWKKETVRKYTNLVVRIARCVVSPEFRGLGLAGLLVKHAAHFAKTHWHVGRMQPLFMEITADMLRYVPFVESAGMRYIGYTEGNLDRVNRDMTYILKNYSRVKKREILKEESAGIVDLQVFYATYLKRVARQSGLSREALLKLLIRSPERLSDEHWTLLYRILRMPKPTFIMGLTPTAQQFLRLRRKKLALPSRYPAEIPASRVSMLKRSISFNSCTLQLSSKPIRTRATRKIQQAFGLNGEMLSTTLFSNLSFEISPGDIVLLCGPSGAGKTSLLSLLAQRLSKPVTEVVGLNGKIESPSSTQISVLSPLDNSRPLINSLGHIPFEHALFALNVSGLAEAHLYVRRFRELSNGQRYRAMVARLIASGASVWVADEFCATLDPTTANIVCRNLRRCAKRFGVTVIVAAANWSEFIHELRPDLIVHLRAPWDCEVFAWPEFNRSLLKSKLMTA
jgi:ABC-type lipoprotein export system ATPase subunit/GNAT superfamily N-acetyltransferase